MAKNKFPIRDFYRKVNKEKNPYTNEELNDTLLEVLENHAKPQKKGDKTVALWQQILESSDTLSKDIFDGIRQQSVPELKANDTQIHTKADLYNFLENRKTEEDRRKQKKLYKKKVKQNNSLFSEELVNGKVPLTYTNTYLKLKKIYPNIDKSAIMTHVGDGFDDVVESCLAIAAKLPTVDAITMFKTLEKETINNMNFYIALDRVPFFTNFTPIKQSLLNNNAKKISEILDDLNGETSTLEKFIKHNAEDYIHRFISEISSDDFVNILKNTEIRISQFIKHHTSTENIIALTKYLSGNNNRKLCSLINSITEENQGDVHDIINKKVDMEVLSKYMINIKTNKLEYIIRYETEKFSEIVSFSGGSETIQQISSEINNTEIHELHDKIDYIYRRFIDKLGLFEKLKERFGGKKK